MKEKRTAICHSFLVDCFNRMAEVLVTTEHYKEAIENFQEVMNLCRIRMDGNERILASAYYNVAYLLTQSQKN